MSDIITADNVFGKHEHVAELKLISMESAAPLGEKINKYLVDWAQKGGLNVDTFQVENQCPRFSSGDSKGLIKDTVRGDDIFILVDVGNYNCTYKYFGETNRMSPDDHYQDLKRIIQAAGGKANRINVIMPLLYGGRQHRRTYRESLDCAFMLQELQGMGVKNLVTFDAHDPRVQNAVPLMGFDNVIPAYQVLKAMFRRYPEVAANRQNLMIVSPDEGALDRNIFYSSVLGLDMGFFYKRRDYTRLVNGRNPIIAHEYLGDSVEGKDILVSDDILSSGDSILDLARQLKKRKANRIFAAATFGLFTNGLDAFNQAYEEGLIHRIISTNLTYRTPELKAAPWFIEADMTKYTAYIIATLNHERSLSKLLTPYDRIKKLLNRYQEQQAKNGFRLV